jgi:hypothetical protein
VPMCVSWTSTSSTSCSTTPTSPSLCACGTGEYQAPLAAVSSKPRSSKVTCSNPT